MLFFFISKVLLSFKLFKFFVLTFSNYIISQPEKQTIAIDLLSNASRTKSNKAKKFGQLNEYNVINIFL